MAPYKRQCPQDIIFRPEERVPPTGPPTPLPAASGLLSRDQPGPTLLSFRGKPAVGWYAAGNMNHIASYIFCKFKMHMGYLFCAYLNRVYLHLQFVKDIDNVLLYNAEKQHAK